MRNFLEEICFNNKKKVPIIVAAEAAECGLACLAMVANYYGHAVDLGSLRQRFPVSIRGMTLRILMTMADQLSLSSRALSLELEYVSNLRMPAILHWDMNHFVVLTKVTAKVAVIHDPSTGRRTITMAELSEHFTGVALELTPAAPFKKIRMQAPFHIHQLWSGMRGLGLTLTEVFLLSFALQIVVFAAPFQLQVVVDQAIYHSDRDLLRVTALGFGTLLLLQCSMQYLRDRIILISGSLFSFQVVGNLVRHLMRLSCEFFEKRHLGDILSRIQSSEPIRNAVTKDLVGAIIDGVMAFFLVVILFIYSQLLALIVVISVLLYISVMLATYPALRTRSLEQIIATAEEQTNLMETLRAAVTIKIMGREIEREACWRNFYARVINTSVSLGTLQITTITVQNVIVGLQTVIIIYVGADLVISGEGFSVGMLIAFLSFRQTFTDRMTSFVNQLVQLKLLGLHLDRLGDIANAESDMSDGSVPPLIVSGNIDARHLSFRYGGGDSLVLDECSLHVTPGEFVAITGPSGGGKSTLIKILLGLYSPDGGEILLDDHPATSGLWRAWRAQVGVVAQDDSLMSGSIADNISFFDPDMQMDQVYAAAAAARVHDDIMLMPMQYLSLIGDMGSALSGGQRQRLLLARALYRVPKVLILDEGTANLDEDTEAEIVELVSKLPITRIVIAHRPALVLRADTVYALECGKLHRVVIQHA